MAKTMFKGRKNIIGILSILIVLITACGKWKRLHDEHEASQSQTGAELSNEFNTEEMRWKRRSFALELMKGGDIEDDRVIQFFEKVDDNLDHNQVDQDSVYHYFSNYIENYWAAYIKTLQEHGKDIRDYAPGFQDLNNKMLKISAQRNKMPIIKVIPNSKEMGEFLLTEATLPR